LSSSEASDASDDELSGSESEFDEEALRKEFDDGYDSELVGDEDDRRRLENMTEKEREQELYNRLEKREALQKRLVLFLLVLSAGVCRRAEYMKKPTTMRVAQWSPTYFLPLPRLINSEILIVPQGVI